MSDDSLLYFDTGVLLNILATERAMEILQAIPYRCAITEDLRNKSSLLSSNILVKMKESEEQSQTVMANSALRYINIHKCNRFSHGVTFVNFARCVPEEKASLLTLVITNNAFLASDDLRTRNVLFEYFPNSSVISTLNILHEWEKRCHVSSKEMQNIALIVQENAQFTPLDSDPLLPWWKSIIGD